MTRSSRALALLAVVVAGCSDDGDDGTDPNTLVLSYGSPSGNVQTAAPGAALSPFRVTLTRGGDGVSGITVNWSVTAGGGTLSAPTTVTNDQGQTEVVLTLGPQVGLNSVTASAAGADGSPLTFSATAVIAGAFAQVEVRNNSFAPNSVTINTGGTVLWVWPQGALQHNIPPAPPGTKPSSTTVRDGPTSYEEVFTQAGTYRYFCQVHGTATTGMTGEVVVQ